MSQDPVMRTARIGRYDISYEERGSGFPVLLIHGLAGDHRAWNAGMARWSGASRVIAPDTRGAGRSTQIDEPVTLEDLARDFIALLDHLEIRRCHVVGRSMGGSISQIMHRLAPERIQSFAWVASCAKFDPFGHRKLTGNREVLEMSAGSWPVWARHTVTDFVSPDWYNVHPAEVAEMERLIGGETRLPACYVRQNHAVLAHDALDILPAIRCPVMILSGSLDPFCGPLATRWMVERVAHARWSEYVGCSHFFWAEQPERFLSEMEAWFRDNAP